MAYLGIYTNDINNYDLSEHKKANSIEELEAKPTSKAFILVYEMQSDTLEDAEFICTKVLKWGGTDAEATPRRARLFKPRYRLFGLKLWLFRPRLWVWRVRLFRHRPRVWLWRVRHRL